MQTISTGSGLSRKNQANVKGQQRLERLFQAVDQIKSDLTMCGKGLPESKRPLFECGSDFFSVRFKRKSVQTILYLFDPEEKTLSRRINPKRSETILEGVTDFYVIHFPESRSVLYRIEVNGRENIRGYIFMVNLTN
jgi:hypothetical protein